MQKLKMGILVFVTLFITAASALATETEISEIELIRNELLTLSAQRLSAFNAMDTRGFIDFHLDSDEFIYAHDGEIVNGRKPWEAMVWEGHTGFVEVEVVIEHIDVQILTSDSAVLTELFSINGKKKSGRLYRGRGTHTLVCTRYLNRWLVVNLAETKAADYGAQQL